MKLLVSLFCCLAAVSPYVLHAEDLVVHAQTEHARTPIYVASLPASFFSPEYRAQLQQILLFDLENDGHSQLVTHHQFDEWIVREAGQNGIQSNVWRQARVRYVCKFEAKGHELTCRIYSTEGTSVKILPTITLTGSLSEDRRKLHKIADQITLNTSQQLGIASTKILYTIKMRNPKKDAASPHIAEVWECDWDGANVRQVTHDNSLNVTPVYLPAKKGYVPGSFLYVSYKNSQPKIYLGSLRTGVSERLCSVRGHQLMPAVNQQRTQLVFICDVGGNPDVFIQPLGASLEEGGKARQLFASVKGTQGSPTFNPKGDYVAFVSNKDGSPRIYILEIPPEGTQLKQMNLKMITKTNRENTSPNWSPDGKKIVYSAVTSGIRQIWVYDVASEQETQLTFSNVNKDNPCFASNSEHIVFNTEDNTHHTGEIYVMHINQSTPLKISTGSGQKRFPSWEPRTS